VSDFVSNNPFAQAAGDVAASFQNGSVEAELTDAAAEAQQQAQDIIANNPAADAVADLSIGDTVSVRDQVQRSFERQQAVSQTVSESPFADEPDDVDVTFDDGQAQTDLAGDAAQERQAVEQTVEQSPFADEIDDVQAQIQGGDIETELTGDAVAAQQQAQDLLSNDPAADTLGDIAIGDGTAEVETEAERQFQSQQRDRLRDLVFSQPDSASIAPIDDPPAREPESETTATETQQGLATDAAAARANRQIAGVRETQAEQAGAEQSEQQQQQQAETRASVSRFGQQQLDAQRVLRCSATLLLRTQ
jgi:3-dehydroquinate dehydratase